MTAAGSRGPAYRRLFAWLATVEDGSILRVAFFGLLVGTLSVLYIDFRDLMSLDGAVSSTPSVPALVPFLPGVLPSSSPTHRPDVVTDRALLEQNLAIDLKPGGVLELTGTIDPGAYERFAAEVEARGEYVTTVSLNSPGGAVQTAMAIGRRIRDEGFATVVHTGALCASSCPLVLAGGVTRHVDADTAIGVHQIFLATPVDNLAEMARDVAGAMHEAQLTTATITRYLGDMDIDAALWVHALETAPQDLYFLSAEEMAEYRLVTDGTVAETEEVSGGAG